MDEKTIVQLINAIMARRTGASGIGVFVDPIILRQIIERVVAGEFPSGHH